MKTNREVNKKTRSGDSFRVTLYRFWARFLIDFLAWHIYDEPLRPRRAGDLDNRSLAAPRPASLAIEPSRISFHLITVFAVD